VRNWRRASWRSLTALTRGGFYAHFSSKGQLYREALVHGDSVDAVLGEYLGTTRPPSAKRLPEFAFLAVDVASKTPEVRAAFTDAFTCISEKLLCHSSAGALAVANTTDNPGLRAKLLASCRENAAALLGGKDRSKPVFFWEPTPN